MTKKIIKNHQHGFTLIELMLVIVIITVMMVSAFRTMQEKATALQVQRAAEQMQSYLAAAQDYYIQNGYWPGSSESGFSSDGDATSATTSALYNAGYISSATLPLTPWGAVYSMCPYAATTSGVENFTCVSGSTATGGNVSFRVFLFVPGPTSKGIGGDIAALLPNGVIDASATQTVVQGSVLGPGGTQDMANYVKNVTVVQPVCYSSAYSPAAGSVCPNTTSGVCWPPPMPGSQPQIAAPTGTDCPSGWIPQIYVSTAGFNSAANLGYLDPSTQGSSVPYMAGYYAIPVTRYSTTTNSSGQNLISGWDIYAASIQQGGVTSASICNPITYTTVGGVTTSKTTSDTSQGGLVTVMTKCVPPSLTSTTLPTGIPAYQTSS